MVLVVPVFRGGNFCRLGAYMFFVSIQAVPEKPGEESGLLRGCCRSVVRRPAKTAADGLYLDEMTELLGSSAVPVVLL